MKCICISKFSIDHIDGHEHNFDIVIIKDTISEPVLKLHLSFVCPAKLQFILHTCFNCIKGYCLHGVSQEKLDVHRTHTPRCEVKKIIALWRMLAVMQGWKEVGCED